MGRAIGFVISVFLVFIAVSVAFQVGMAVSGQVIGSTAFATLMFVALMAGLMSAFFRGHHRREGRWIDHRRTMLEEWHRQAHGDGARSDRPAV
ncbi:MAG: hypothetical protein FJ028_03780 [Chloroflexi bacterium]|nr:hypothetical protein [Chloroflexota bacterium]